MNMMPLLGDLVADRPPGGGLRVGLINNMPDPALRRTEQQFRSLLASATADMPIELVMTTLPEIDRLDWAAQHVRDTYSPVDVFQATELDVVIVTGAEPRAAHLADEPYWASLTRLFDWIEDTRLPAAYCCLAAHAAVLHRDGIRRRRLPQKCFGVFEHRAIAGHVFTQDADATHVLPHSRWNDIAEAELLGAGYAVLSRSDEVGVGAFAREGSAELFFQGHPEYSGTTLLREYRRDVRRFLFCERDIYPGVPVHGMGDDMTAVFEAFQARAVRDRRAVVFEDFPSFAAADARALPWRPAAALIYRNWLRVAVPNLPRSSFAATEAGQAITA